MTSTVRRLWIFFVAVPLIVANNEIIGYTKLYSQMQTSMNILITKQPANKADIFDIDQFITISITSPNIIQLQFDGSSIIYQHSIEFNLSYTLNITLHPSNNHYSLYQTSNTNIKTQTFTFTPSPSTYTTSHPITIHNNNLAQITNLFITTNANEYILYSSSFINHNNNNNNNINRILSDTQNVSIPTTTTTKADDIDIWPNIPQTQEIIYLILIIVAVICMVSIVAYATVRRCTRRNRERKAMSVSKVRPYQPVGKHARAKSASIVHYVDETPGDHDIEHIKHIQLPLTDNKKSDDSNPSPTEEGVGAASPMDVGMTTDGGETQGAYNGHAAYPQTDNGAAHLVPTHGAERDDSFSAMNI